MDDPAIQLGLDTLMPEVIKGDQEALDALMRSEWMLKLLSRIADWAEGKKKVEADERGTSIQEIVAARIREKLHTVKNPNNAPWDKTLTRWSYRVAARRCEDVRKKRTRLVEEHRRAVEHESTQRKEHGVRIYEPSSPTPSPEEELERKEQAPLREKLGSTIHRTTLKARDAATREEKLILTHWLEHKTLQQIHELTGIPLATVHRKLKRIQKTIIAEVEKGITEEIGEARAEACGVAEVLEGVVKNRDELRELIANSMEHASGHVQASPPGG
jgi:DNA-directed RNA polymerase specialized sigma24 family protein